MCRTISNCRMDDDNDDVSSSCFFNKEREFKTPRASKMGEKIVKEKVGNITRLLSSRVFIP